MALHASVHALEFRQRRFDCVLRDTHFECDRDCGERVQHVMHSRQIQRDVHILF